jgi:2-amino-4-hydroxy-6-hydroxymethyldihydropteridine diphosphokinase
MTTFSQTTATVKAYLALGSNLGFRLGHLQAAAMALDTHQQITITGYSRIYETAPVGGPAGQGAFLNAVIQLQTTLPARELLAFMLSIEKSQGRQRIETWGPRTLDLDLLLYGTEVIHEPGLTVPHLRLTERNFVLVPLSDLAPNLIIPGQQQTIKELKMIAGDAGVELTQLTF